MAGPWTQYQGTAMAGPWTQYGQAAPQRPTAQQQAQAYQQALQQQADAMPFWQKALVGAGKAFTDVGRGAEQLVGIKPTGALAPSPEADAALMNTAGGKIGDLGAQALMMTALGGGLGAGARGLGLASKAIPYVNSAIASGAIGGLQPVSGDESRLKNTLEAAGLGAAGEAVPALLGAGARAAAPVYSAAKQAAIGTADRFGIPLHLTQMADSRFGQVLGSTAQYLPFSGAASAQNAQRMAWNRALASTMGEDASELTPQVVAHAKQLAGADYDRVFGANSIEMDEPALSALASAQAKAHAELLPENAALVDQQIDRVLNAAANNGGAVPGIQYQDLRNSLKDSVSANPTLTHHLGAVRSALEDAASRQIPDLGPINARYNNIKTIEKGLTQNGGANNTITPANLWHLTQGKFGATPQMQALAQLGQTVLKDQVANSGTAQRLLAYRMMPGLGTGYDAGVLGAAMIPHMAVPMLGASAVGATVGRALNSNAVAHALPFALSRTLGGAQRLSAPLAPRLLPLLSTQPTVPAALAASQ